MTESERTLLRADVLRQDPRLEQAMQLLRDAVTDAQAPLNKVCRPQSGRTIEYEELLDRLAAGRGGKTYFPYLSSGLGNGPWVELDDGSVKLDFITGIGVHGMGHSNLDLVTAGVRAALQDTVMQGNLQQNPPTVHVLERLLALARQHGAPLGNCLLTTSGAMANENALKIAFYNRAPADRIIAFDNCFAGRSIAMAQLTDRPKYRTGVPTALAVDYIPPSDAENSAESIERSVAALDKQLKRHPGKYAALWMELVAGEGGYYPGSTEFFTALIERANQDDVLIIFDEVQSFGRLSRPFAMQHFQLDQYADIVTIGKISQLCATFYRETLHPKDPLLSQTFTAASSAIEACLVLLDQMEQGSMFGPEGTNMQIHHHFASGLQRLAEQYPGQISGPFGAGMMIAFTPGDGSANAASELVHRMFAAGLMGFVAGGNPARIRFLPPPTVTKLEHVDAALAILGSILAD
ncbi:MAG TPA: aspartate aminotransferase family protein [Planctomycetaceae bacterium]|nr:aspartate aminotransferase family protein [Planctomycetaceae bacterium]